ncbi:hypothetical protein [Halovivax sp.]|nr:hypothetical protein [Halovivax sp.]
MTPESRGRRSAARGSLRSPLAISRFSPRSDRAARQPPRSVTGFGFFFAR